MSTDPKVEEIRARLEAATPGPWTWEVSPDRHWAWVGNEPDFWDQPVAKCADDDTAEFIANSPADIVYLLTKLDEAEATSDRLRMAWHEDVTAIQSQRDAAEERERVLIAGVREALAIANEYPPTASSNPTSEDGLRRAARYAVAARFRIALSRLLPSTPTEEGKNDHE